MLTNPRPLPLLASGIESLAVVGDRELGAVADAQQPDICVAGARVRDDVVQRFLRDPVQTERGLRVDRLEVSLRT